MTQTATKKARNTNYSAGFLEFWVAYGKKVGKQECWDLWRSRELETETQKVLEGVRVWKKSKRWMEGYKMDPARFIRNYYYEDEPDSGLEINTLKEAVQAFNEGLWTKVNGIDCEGQRLGHNSTGLYLNRTNMIMRANDLKKAKFE